MQCSHEQRVVRCFKYLGKKFSEASEPKSIRCGGVTRWTAGDANQNNPQKTIPRMVLCIQKVSGRWITLEDIEYHLPRRCCGFLTSATRKDWLVLSRPWDWLHLRSAYLVRHPSEDNTPLPQQMTSDISNRPVNLGSYLSTIGVSRLWLYSRTLSPTRYVGAAFFKVKASLTTQRLHASETQNDINRLSKWVTKFV